MTCFSELKITKINADCQIFLTHNSLNVNNLCGFSDEVHIVFHQLQNPVMICRVLVADTSALDHLERVEIDLYRFDAVAVLVLRREDEGLRLAEILTGKYAVVHFLSFDCHFFYGLNDTDHYFVISEDDTEETGLSFLIHLLILVGFLDVLLSLGFCILSVLADEKPVMGFVQVHGANVMGVVEV